MSEKKKKLKLKAPNAMLILVIIVLASAIASYVVPAGLYDRVADPATGRMLVNPDTLHYIDQTPIGFFEFFESLTIGLQNSGYIIFFLLIIGGVFGIMDATGALHVGMANLIKKMAGKEILLVPICMVVFGLGSACAGNFEEFLAFFPLMVTVCLAMGFDSMTAMGIVWMAAACGYSGGFTNAFTVGVAQGIAGLPLFSGMWLRIAAFVAFLSVSIVYVTMHAIKVRKNPESSPVYEEDKTHVVNIDVYNVPKLTIRHKLVLLILVGSVVALIVGVTQFGFYIDELSAVFLIAGVLAGIVGGLKPGEMTDEFIKGCGNLLWAGMAIGLCGAATYILQSTNIIDTVIHFMSGLLQGLPAALSACGMFVVQNILNILIPSGSGQAAVTMPIMAPLSDVLGVTRQTAVLAFQFGDSFTNVVTPTCATLMAALSMAKVPWGKWIKFLTPLYAVWVVITFAFLIFAVKVGYGPF
ncbi:Uncharacterised protein [[Clostridium] symbiosum]|uniref:TIGR00366 family protein n=1 Tax=Clostridium symbiosum TaxID=1512 RepID=A0A6N3FY55_CLOSY|nr:TIGR00366 family protein [[Clostridium] symbiosum]MCK0084520.1 TIGR00366 family protein [[Clostridium] symbiosum]